MEVVKVIDVDISNSDYSVVWFEVDEYPNYTFGLKHFPEGKFQKDYIIIHPDHDYFEEINKIETLRQNLEIIRGNILSIVETNEDVKLKFLFTSIE